MPANVEHCATYPKLLLILGISQMQRKYLVATMP